MNKYLDKFLVFILTVTLFGCVSLPPTHQEIADALTATEKPYEGNNIITIEKIWAPNNLPEEQKLSYKQTPANKQNSNIPLKKCIEFLNTSNYRYQPTTTAAEITQCMNQNGWQLLIFEYVRVHYSRL